MGRVFYRWLVLKLMTMFRRKEVLFMFYTGGAVDGFVGWIEVKGHGTLAFVKPDGRYVYRWEE